MYTYIYIYIYHIHVHTYKQIYMSSTLLAKAPTGKPSWLQDGQRRRFARTVGPKQPEAFAVPDSQAYSELQTSWNMDHTGYMWLYGTHTYEYIYIHT